MSNQLSLTCYVSAIISHSHRKLYEWSVDLMESDRASEYGMYIGWKYNIMLQNEKVCGNIMLHNEEV